MAVTVIKVLYPNDVTYRTTSLCSRSISHVSLHNPKSKKVAVPSIISKPSMFIIPYSLPSSTVFHYHSLRLPSSVFLLCHTAVNLRYSRIATVSHYFYHIHANSTAQLSIPSVNSRYLKPFSHRISSVSQK